VQIIVRSDSLEFINSLKKSELDQAADVSFEIDGPYEIPGMFETWFEIAATVGIFAIPVSVVTNLLSSWIWSKLYPMNKNGIEGQIIVRNGEKEIQVDLSNIDKDTLNEIIKMVVDNVDSR
jgi:hypothetical protein